MYKDKWGNMHSLPDEYDNKEIIVPSTQTETFQDVIPTDILSRRAYNYNRASTRTDEARAVTVLIGGPTHGDDGLELGKKRPRNW